MVFSAKTWPPARSPGAMQEKNSSLPFEAREEDPKSKARRTYNKSNKCEKCDERFISKDALSKHIDSVHSVRIVEVGRGVKMVLPSKQLEKLSVTKEVAKQDKLSSKKIQENSPTKHGRKEEEGTVLYRRSEQAEKENEARRENSVVKWSDRPNCRFCKSNTFLDLQCPEREKKAPALDLFDAEAFLEAEFRKLMGDQVSDDVEVFSSEDLSVLEEAKSEDVPRCVECQDDFFWPTPSHSCVFTAHGRVVLGGKLVGDLPCLDQNRPPPLDCRVCPPWLKCGQCLETFSGKDELKVHKETNHPAKLITGPSPHLAKAKVIQRKVATNLQVLPSKPFSKPLKRPAEAFLLNLPKSTRIELNGQWLNARSVGLAGACLKAPAKKLVERQCDDCGEKFGSATAFGEHLFDPLSDMFVCMECASEGQQQIGDFPNQCQLTKHKKSDHRKRQNGNFVCPSCGLSCKSRYLLKKHTEKRNPCNQISAGRLSSMKMRLPLSSTVSIRYAPMDAPMEVDNRGEVTESLILEAFKNVENRRLEPESSLPCLYCANIFNNTNKLINHMKKKHNVQYENDSYLIPCIYCDEEFKDKDELREHVEESHERDVSPLTVEVNQEDLKMLFPQEPLEVKKEIFPDYREFEEEVELNERVEGEPDDKLEIGEHLKDFEEERIMQENTDIKMEPVWIFQ